MEVILLKKPTASSVGRSSSLPEKREVRVHFPAVPTESCTDRTQGGGRRPSESERMFD